MSWIPSFGISFPFWQSVQAAMVAVDFGCRGERAFPFRELALARALPDWPKGRPRGRRKPAKIKGF